MEVLADLSPQYCRLDCLQIGYPYIWCLITIFLTHNLSLVGSVPIFLPLLSHEFCMSISLMSHSYPIIYTHDITWGYKTTTSMGPLAPFIGPGLARFCFDVTAQNGTLMHCPMARRGDVWHINIWLLNGGLIILGFFFWSGLGIIFGFLLLCFSCFSAFLLFLLFLLLYFSAFLLFCFSCFSASLLSCFFAFLLLLLLCFSAFLLFCFSCFFASLLFLLFLLFCFSCFFAFLLFCFCAFPVSLLLCFFASLFFFALLALNTWFSCKMHFAQYLHPWVSHDQPSLEN